MKNKSIKIPDSLYVGLSPFYSGTRVPLGYMTPYGTDKAAQNRIKNVKHGVTRHTPNNSVLLGATVIENKPLVGFRITGRMYNSSSQSFWYIEDPRGFEVEITSANITQLMTSGIVDRGELLFSCVWARDGASNVLISTESEEYLSAFSNTMAAKGKASWKDVKIGDTVLLRNNTKGRWMGKFYLILNHGYGVNTGTVSANEYTFSDKPYHIIYDPDYKSGTDQSAIYIISTPQLSKIVSSDPITKAESEVLVNEYIQDSNCLHNSNLYRKVIAASFDAITTDQLKLVQEPIKVDLADELNELVGTSYSNVMPSVFIKTNNMFGKVRNNRNPTTSNPSLFHIIEYSYPHVEKAELRRVLVEHTNNYRYQKMYSENHVSYAFNAQDQFYNFRLNMKTTQGNEVNLYVT